MGKGGDWRASIFNFAIFSNNCKSLIAAVVMYGCAKMGRIRAGGQTSSSVQQSDGLLIPTGSETVSIRPHVPTPSSRQLVAGGCVCGGFLIMPRAFPLPLFLVDVLDGWEHIPFILCYIDYYWVFPDIHLTQIVLPL